MELTREEQKQLIETLLIQGRVRLEEHSNFLDREYSFELDELHSDIFKDIIQNYNEYDFSLKIFSGSISKFQGKFHIIDKYQVTMRKK